MPISSLEQAIEKSSTTINLTYINKAEAGPSVAQGLGFKVDFGNHKHRLEDAGKLLHDPSTNAHSIVSMNRGTGRPHVEPKYYHHYRDPVKNMPDSRSPYTQFHVFGLEPMI